MCCELSKRVRLMESLLPPPPQPLLKQRTEPLGTWKSQHRWNLSIVICETVCYDMTEHWGYERTPVCPRSHTLNTSLHILYPILFYEMKCQNILYNNITNSNNALYRNIYVLTHLNLRTCARNISPIYEITCETFWQLDFHFLCSYESFFGHGNIINPFFLLSFFHISTTWSLHLMRALHLLDVQWSNIIDCFKVRFKHFLYQLYACRMRLLF